MGDNAKTYTLFSASSASQPAKRRKKHTIIVWLPILFLVAAITVLLVLCGEPVLVILNDCDDVIHYRQNVNVAPLMNLEIPPDMDLTNWTNSHAAEDSIGRIGVFTNVERFPTIEAASSQFYIECERRPYRPDNVYGGQDDNRYCISYVETVRADPEGLCQPLGQYASYVIIQKGNVIIALYELSDQRTSTAKDEAIRRLADELSEAIHR